MSPEPITPPAVVDAERSASPMPSPGGANGSAAILGAVPHIWRFRQVPTFRHEIECCDMCGLIRRRDGKDSSCRGPVRISLRDLDHA